MVFIVAIAALTSLAMTSFTSARGWNRAVSHRLAGDEATPSGNLSFRPRSENRLEPQATILSGILVNEEGKPLKDVLVEVFPGKDPRVGRTTATRTNANGGFSIHAPNEEWCRLVFTHDREDVMLSARTDIDQVPLRTAEGGRLELGTLILRWYGVTLSVQATFAGKPVSGIAINLPPQVNRPEPIVTDSNGRANLSLALGKGDEIVLFADGGKEYSGWYTGLVHKPGERREVEIPLVRGRANLRCAIVDAAGRPLQRKTWVYVGPAAAEMVDRKIFPGQSFKYVPSYYAAETDEFGRCRFDHLAPGQWHISAVLDGARLYPDGAAGKVIDLEPGDDERVSLKAPFSKDKSALPLAQPARVEGRVDYSIAGHTLTEWAGRRRVNGITSRPLRVGVYLIPQLASGEFLFQPVAPNLVLDLGRSNSFVIENLPAGEYLVFAGGVRQWPDPTQLPDQWMLSRGAAPTWVVGKTVLKPGTVVRLDMLGDLDAKETARRYREPVNAVKRFLAHLAFQFNQKEGSNNVDKK
jgi:hypothetical protein